MTCSRNFLGRFGLDYPTFVELIGTDFLDDCRFANTATFCKNDLGWFGLVLSP